MTKTATVIPIHPPRYVHAPGLVESWLKYCETDLYFVFSNEEDSESFKKVVSTGYKSLVLPESMRHYKNPITVKKYYGVAELMGKYDYIGVFDCEIKVVRPFYTDCIYSEIWNSKELKCNRCFPDVHGGALVRGNSNLMGLEGNENLKRETDNFEYYWWFNEICVYESAMSREFFDWLKANNLWEAVCDEYWCFDYVIFGIWLICFKGWKCKRLYPDRKFGFGAIEHNQFNIGNVTEEFMSYMDSNMHPELYEHIKVQFHMDRYIKEADKHLVRLDEDWVKKIGSKNA